MKRILFIDDDSMVLRMAAFIMKRSGCEAVTASSGEEGIRLAGDEKPDAVFVDVEMPVMNGFETLEKLKAVTSAPIFMMTGTVTEEGRQRAEAKGAAGVISKPLQAGELVSMINKTEGV